jgi:hypothetical protein
MGTEGQTAGQEGQASLIIYDNTHFPSPPTKITMETSLNDTTEEIISKVSEKTGYKEDVFELTHKGKRLESGKRLADFQTTKFLLNINRLPHAKVCVRCTYAHLSSCTLLSSNSGF